VPYGSKVADSFHRDHACPLCESPLLNFDAFDEDRKEEEPRLDDSDMDELLEILDRLEEDEPRRQFGEIGETMCEW